MHGVSGKSITGTNAPFFDGSQPCRGLDTDIFYPDDEDPVVKARMTQKARAELKPLCASCAFSAPCLEWAVANKEHGIWAGTTEADRKRIRRFGLNYVDNRLAHAK